MLVIIEEMAGFRDTVSTIDEFNRANRNLFNGQNGGELGLRFEHSLDRSGGLSTRDDDGGNLATVRLAILTSVWELDLQRFRNHLLITQKGD